MATVGSSVAVWVVMVMTLGEISAQCGNTSSDLKAMASRIKECADPITAFGKAEIDAVTRHISKTCSGLECRLSCMDTVIGNCDTTGDFYALFDKQTFHASYRGLCADTTVAKNAITGCADAMVTALRGCLKYYTLDFFEMAKYMQTDNGALYKQTACSAMASLAACFNLSPIGSCTSTYADFINIYFKTSLTYATCGHHTTNQWFQEYSRPVNITGLTCLVSVVAPSTIHPTTSQMFQDNSGPVYIKGLESGVSEVAPSTHCQAAMACFVALIRYMYMQN